MRVIGLVGGIGAGKSEAASILAEMGALVIDADKVGHAVYEPGTAGLQAVVGAFGKEILASDGTIDRKRLGARVFTDPAELARLNAIVHPLIRHEIERRITEAKARAAEPAVVLEAAILLDAGWTSIVDEVWVLTVSPETARARLAASRGLTAEEVDARMARQMPDAERRAAADVVIENESDRGELRRRLSELWEARIAR